ncbi:MAG: CAP domain-containing protein [Candidatus Bathyarchaeia archaeon]
MILSGVIIYAYGPQVVVWIENKIAGIQPEPTGSIKYQLTIKVIGSGITYPSPGTYAYDNGTEITVDAVPDSGWKLDHWEIDGSNTGSAGSQMVIMNANHTIVAVFDRAIDELVNYALSLINIDRTTHGLVNVSLSPIESAQEHAEDMLKHNYLSHWGTDGYKPYMRYTLAGGQGAVAENCAWQYSSGFLDVKEAIKDLEWNMMYDDADSDWGHRDNILDPFHNKVSIGIAYDDHNVYYVQDFEDDYIDWATFMDVNDDGEVTLSGSFRIRQFSLQSINIFYDAPPTNLTSDQLNSFQYSGSYSQGTFVGMALPPNYESVEGITITARTWIQTGNYFQIRFDLSQAFNVYGEGVYTLYLQSDSDSFHYLTSYSFWYN